MNEPPSPATIADGRCVRRIALFIAGALLSTLVLNAALSILTLERIYSRSLLPRRRPRSAVANGWLRIRAIGSTCRWRAGARVGTIRLEIDKAAIDRVRLDLALDLTTVALVSVLIGFEFVIFLVAWIPPPGSGQHPPSGRRPCIPVPSWTPLRWRCHCLSCPCTLASWRRGRDCRAS